MTNKEAIKVIQSIRPKSRYVMLNEALGISIEAIEKQIPKNPIRNTKQLATCPSCGGSVSKSNIWEHIVEKEATFCEHCGQALDWGDK